METCYRYFVLGTFQGFKQPSLTHEPHALPRKQGMLQKAWAGSEAHPQRSPAGRIGSPCLKRKHGCVVVNQLAGK